MIRDPDNENRCFYQAFSPEDEDRPRYLARRDIMYHIGFQESHPSDKNTLIGNLENFIERASSLPQENRGDAIRCIIRNDYTLNDSYDAVSINGEYQVSSDNGHWQTIPHVYVQANLNFEADSDSDSTSSSDSDDS